MKYMGVQSAAKPEFRLFLKPGCDSLGTAEMWNGSFISACQHPSHLCNPVREVESLKLRNKIKNEKINRRKEDRNGWQKNSIHKSHTVATGVVFFVSV
jgi:hypothetical protein